MRGRHLLSGLWVALIVAGTAVDAAAQTVISDTVLQFIGNWTRDTSVPRGDCGGLLDPRGNPVRDCSTPMGNFPMNDRAKAWLQYYDELQSPHLNECAAITVPNLLGDVRPFGISFKTDRAIFNYEQMNIIREVWMDGRKHPPATDLFQQGHAIGRWEGDELVVETTNFTFDPEGIDDHYHMPSSVRKKVVERYKLAKPDLMTITITLDDPVFMTKPYTYVHQWKRSAKPLVGWWECDPDVTRTEMRLSAPVKYPGSDK